MPARRYAVFTVRAFGAVAALLLANCTDASRVAGTGMRTSFLEPSGPLRISIEMAALESPDVSTGTLSASGYDNGSKTLEIGSYPIETLVDMTLTGQFVYSGKNGTFPQGVCSQNYEIYIRNRWGELNRLHFNCNAPAGATSITIRTGAAGTVYLRQLGWPIPVDDAPWTVTQNSSLTIKRVEGLSAGVGYARPGKSYPEAADSILTSELPWGWALHMVAIPTGTFEVYADVSTWRFVPDDGSPEQAGCEFPYTTFCYSDIRPDRSGMLHVSGIVNGKYAAAKPIHIIVPGSTKKPTVSCGSLPLERGKEIVCTTSGFAVVGKWTFTPDSDALGTITKDANVASAEWKGPLVTSGTVSADGWVKQSDYKPGNPSSGRTQATATRVTVAPRDWSQDTVEYDIRPVAGPYGDPPTAPNELGLNSIGYKLRTDGYRAVPSGPNEGMGYYTSLPYRLDFEVSINRAALAIGSTFHGYQPRTRQTVGGVPYCAGDELPLVIPLVKAHEGYSMNDINSHTEVYNRYFLQEVRQKTEALVAPNIVELNAAPVAAAANTVAGAQSLAVTHARATNPFRYPCVFNYDPNRKFR